MCFRSFWFLPSVFKGIHALYVVPVFAVNIAHLSPYSFFLEYAKFLHIFIIKVEQSNHTNDTLIESALGGQQE